MDNNDKLSFKELFEGVSEYYRQDNLSPMAMKIYFDALVRFEFNQISQAISQHIQNTHNGQFYPKVSDIVRLIEGGDVSTDSVIASARLAETPFGILSRIQIGTWDLEHQTDMFYLKQRAEECLLLLPEWKSRATRGDYTDHEISIMLKHSVDPLGPFNLGLPRPGNQNLLRSRIEKIEVSPRHQFLLESLDQEEWASETDKSVLDFISKTFTEDDQEAPCQ